nr:hypothetical protein B0A51_01536 [Rachicladosporium sp. CCFEE 5018]
MRNVELWGNKARGRLWASSGEEYREEAGERPEMDGYDTDYKGETLGNFIDKTLKRGRKEWCGFVGFDWEESFWEVEGYAGADEV